MQRLCVLTAGLLLLLLFLFGQAAAAADDIMIDVENGVLKTGIYEIPLSKSVEKPISVGMEDGNVILIVQTEVGSKIRLNLGQGRAAFTSRSNAYLRLWQASDLAGGQGGNENCEICEKPLSYGNHSRLPCGHYVCVVSPNHNGGVCPTCNNLYCDGDNHAICPQCGVGFCGHDDDACPSRFDPALYPFAATGPTGEALYYYLSPDGEFMIGHPGGEPPPEWSPAFDYLSSASPASSPAPTWQPSDGYSYIGEHGETREYSISDPPPGWHWESEYGRFAPNTPVPQSTGAP